ncbi:MAG: DUF3795 domain-containing protein [Candidatus Electryoneaceae bacterium]|nr:DUF3795 domain-containing protein [Candidatus Electryoneaceae bacterium]
MEILLGVCGDNCSEYPAYIATMNNDNELRAKTAIEWSQGYSVDLKPEDIHCVGCTTSEGLHFAHCDICDARLCGLERNLTSCGNCEDYPCDKLDQIFEVDPSAKERLDVIKGSVT